MHDPLAQFPPDFEVLVEVERLTRQRLKWTLQGFRIPMRISSSLSRRRIASGRDGLGSGSPEMNTSRSARRSGGMRTPTCVAPTRGRPIFFLSSETFDITPF